MLSAILASVRSMDKARVAKSGGVAVVISAGLSAAAVAGLPIPVWGQAAGLVLGVVAYQLLPPSAEAKVDSVVDEAIDVATIIPQTYSAPSDYPAEKPDNVISIKTNMTNNGNPVGG